MAAISNFPTKPQRQGITSQGFPSDLPSNFSTQITFIGGGAGQATGIVRLPLPKRLNDVQNIIWEEVSLTSMALSQTLQTAASLGGYAMGGYALNPFMFMLFKRPTFKEHVLSWTLAPNSQQESDKIRDIVKTLKKASLPTKAGFGGGAIMKYPALAQVTLNPGDWLYKLKPAAITSVHIDYTGAGLSFFNSQAPTVVNLTLQLKETELWSGDDPGLQ